MMQKRVIVVGGGISGLSAAHRLAQGGAQVVLVEGSDQLGGLGTFFERGEAWIDRFYHCIMPTDSALLGLIEEIGLSERIYFKPTRMGFIVDGRRFQFNTPLDLLRFGALSIPDRFRLGVMSLLMRKLGEGRDLDNLRTETFLAGLFGRRIYQRFWSPLFRSKFGPHAGDLPALYLWQRLGREKNKSTRGYLKCGLKGVIDGLSDAISHHGGEIRLKSPVRALRETRSGMKVELHGGERIFADSVLSTVPLPLLRGMTRGCSLENQYRDPGLETQGVVNAIFFLKKGLDGNYWTPIVNSNTTFDGVVEMSTLVDRTQYEGSHVVYAMKYCGREDPLFQASEPKIAARWSKELLDLYQDLPLVRRDISEVRVFKAPFVEPVYPLGYLGRKPEMRVGTSGLFLATTAQVYPSITSWNASVELATRTADTILEQPDRSFRKAG